jgi:predicted transcriptional regulator of viral defense system
MQPIRKLRETLAALADQEHCLFATSDLAGAVPDCRQLPLLLSRAAKAGMLRRVCKGVYFYPIRDYPRGNLLFHAASLLRASEFNYISLESALSDAGLISQLPINWITLMSSGRSHIVNCGAFGNIEFVHTARKADELADELTYDATCRLWRASTNLALRDMKLTRRSMDLVDKEALLEPV